MIFCPVLSIFRSNGLLENHFTPIILFPTGNIAHHSFIHVPVDQIGDENNKPDHFNMCLPFMDISIRSERSPFEMRISLMACALYVFPVLFVTSISINGSVIVSI
jgi:hypothetical protein